MRPLIATRAGALVVGLAVLSAVSVAPVSGATWVRTLGTSGDERCRLIPSRDDGYFCFGYTTSTDGIGSAALLKLDAGGGIIWQRKYTERGAGRSPLFTGLTEASDGSLSAVGTTTVVTTSSITFEAWAMKLSSTGTVVWRRVFTSNLMFEALTPTDDGGFVAGGNVPSTARSWLVKLSSTGSVLWQRMYGSSSGLDSLSSLTPAPEGGFYYCGQTHYLKGTTSELDALLYRLDRDGEVIWRTSIGAAGKEDHFQSVLMTSDGGCLVAGYTEVAGVDTDDLWVVKFLSDGKVAWQKRYGGNGIDDAWALGIAQNGEYIVTGITDSFGAGYRDGFLMRLSNTGQIRWQEACGSTGTDTLWSSVHELSDQSIVAMGVTTSFGLGSSDVLFIRVDGTGKVPGTSCGAVAKSKAWTKSTTMKPVTTTPTAAVASFKSNVKKPKLSAASLDSSSVCEGN